jgi:uncharacterized protein (DUF1778 family)
MTGAAMAKKKTEQRSPKNKERQGTGFRTIGVRTSAAFADWLEQAAKLDRVSVAAFIEKAVVERAKAIGLADEAPERIP